MIKKARSRPGEKGATLLATAAMILTLFSMLALAFDLGRVYLARNEAQTFTDSASLEATLELDGTATGILRAQNKVQYNSNKWNFGSEAFGSVALAFATTKDGPWETTVLNPVNYRYARVSTTVPVPLTFFPASSSSSAALPHSYMGLILLAGTMSVNADSRAGQESKDSYREGLLPFSPFAHTSVGPHYGLAVGNSYTLRWASSPHMNGTNTCSGDRVQSMIDLAQAGGGEERGFIEETSASTIRDAIIYNYQTINRTIGDPVVMSGGAKQTMLDALIERVNQDSDASSTSFSSYVSLNQGNGRRLVGVPINTGFPSYTIVQIGAFFLPTAQEFSNGGNKPICAEYVGAWLHGSKHKAAAEAGSYVSRLVR